MEIPDNSYNPNETFKPLIDKQDQLIPEEPEKIRKMEKQGWCNICERYIIFVNTFSPSGFWICTQCQRRTKNLGTSSISIEDQIVRRRFKI